jgi:uncharacterized membrane protein YdjX (TVP38/TMEM64 family)
MTVAVAAKGSATRHDQRHSNRGQGTTSPELRRYRPSNEPTHRELVAHYAGCMDSRRTALRRIALYGVAWALLFGALVLTGNVPSSSEARDFADELGPLAVVLYVPLFAVANFLIPWVILAGAAGLLWGTAAGTPLALAGLTAAALTQMAVARWLAAGHHGGLLPERARRVEHFLTRNGAVAVMESRIVPALPYGIVNYSAGITHLTYRDMALGTLIGAAPKVFAYTALGGNLDDLTSPEAITAVVLLVILGLAGALFVWRQIGESPSPRGAPGTPPEASPHRPS